MSDHDRISPLQYPYNIKQTSDENKEQCRLPNSLNYYHKNCLTESKENYSQDLGSERVNKSTSKHLEYII